MRFTISFVVIFAICFSLSPVAAQDKVVVIPLSSTRQLQNVVTVSASGGDFTDPVKAVNSISQKANYAKPYLVVIGPGVYTLTQPLHLGSGVHLTGAGQNATKLTGALSTGAENTSTIIYTHDNNYSLSNLTIENTGGSIYSVAIYSFGSFFGSGYAPNIQNVAAIASGGTHNIGLFNKKTFPTITNMTISASGGSNNIGISNVNSSPNLSNVTVSTSEGTSNQGIVNVYSHPILDNVTIIASDGSYNYGMVNENSDPILSNVNVSAFGGTNNYGVDNYSSSPSIRDSTIKGNTQAIRVSADTVRVVQSSILGPVSVDSGGILSCVNSDNGVNTLLDSSCM